jgi:predicted MFS family arabinose efflux permease
MVAFEVLPILLLGPVIGLVVDRYPRRSLMVAADLARAALILALVIVGDSVVLAYAVAFGLSALTQVFNPAASAILPDVVRSDDLVDANAKLWTAAVLAQIVLAPLAGLAVATYGTGPAFAINSVSYLVSAALLGGLSAGRTPPSRSSDRWTELLGGVRAVRSHPLLARLAAVQVLASLSAGATGGLLVVLSAERLRVGPAGFGGLLGAIGLGAAGGPLLLGRFIRPADRRWLFGPLAVRGLVDLALAASTTPLVAAPALALYGVGTSTGMIAYQSTLQREVATEVRGRVFVLYDLLWNASRLISLGLGGLLADAVGIQTVYLAGGLLLFIAFAVGWAAPALRRDL